MSSTLLKQMWIFRKGKRLRQREQKSEDEDKKLKRNASSDSERSTVSETASISSETASSCDEREEMSFSYRRIRRHAICEENVREYYSFWWSKEGKIAANAKTTNITSRKSI